MLKKAVTLFTDVRKIRKKILLNLEWFISGYSGEKYYKYFLKAVKDLVKEKTIKNN